MKTKLRGTAVAALILATGVCSFAQERPKVAAKESALAGSIATGSVVSLAPDQGTLAVRATGSKPAVVFHGIDSASIVTTTGRQAALGNVRVGLPVTVYYVPRQKLRMVTKIVIPDTIVPQVTAAPALTPAEAKALQSPAANDGDITTEPGVKARIDDDITTQAGKNALSDPDITKRPR